MHIAFTLVKVYKLDLHGLYKYIQQKLDKTSFNMFFKSQEVWKLIYHSNLIPI